MKRLVCMLFLLILFCVGVVFEDKNIDICHCVKPTKIAVISSEQINDDYVFNGNLVISNFSSLQGVDLTSVMGVTFEVCSDFNIDVFINNIGLHNYKKYMVGGQLIIEGNLQYKNNLNFDSVQIAIREDAIIIGFPMILNSF